ncbi:MAG TPA: CTP synthase [Clostridia bacterium]
MAKYIFITGGVVSGLGKGITAASLGRLLKQRGLKVSNQKFDPYINVDPGMMSPYQHGEVFVTEDGAETDLDIGHYERFVDENLTIYSNITTGKIYSKILRMERNGEFLGNTVQVVPHITNEIKQCIYRVAQTNPDIDVVITEIGGTVGDIESTPFLEAIRQVPFDVGRENVLYIHVTLIPYLRMSGEIKTKPTQHSVKELQKIGITPDILVCRTELELDEENKNKLAMFCNVTSDAVIQNKDSEILYEVPLELEKEGLANVVCQKLKLKCESPDLTEWTNIVENIKKIRSSDRNVTIGLVGKYVELHDAYLSVVEALKHGGLAHQVNVNIKWISSEDVNEQNAHEYLKGLDGIIVPGGFGDRGIDGKIAAAKYARENNIPYFGICLGMQVAAIEFARNVVGYKDAHSVEFDPNTQHPIIHLAPKNIAEESFKCTRLGAYQFKTKEGSLARDIYQQEIVSERHRNKYEFNNDYLEIMEKHGLVFSGLSIEESFVEIIELKNHKWFVGVQFHPEFKSRPNRPHPLFASFIKASANL